MSRLALTLSLFLIIQVRSSSESPPRLRDCRVIHKSKESQENYTFSSSSGACGDEIVRFPIPPALVINITDTRNCENYFKCEDNSCHQCPCPLGENFNPITKRCSVEISVCACPSTTTSTTTTTTTTTVAPVTTTTDKSDLYVSNPPADVLLSASSTDNPSSQASDYTNEQKNDKDGISNEVIIISAIVSATVIVIAVIVMVVLLWQKGRLADYNRRSPHKTAPPTNQDGYSSSVAPSERHVYAEIDDRVISASKHWQHGGSMRAPPLPDHQPPLVASSSQSSPCPHHHHQPVHHQMYSDSGMGSITDSSFTNPSSNFHAPKTMFTQVKYIDHRPVHTCGCISNNHYHNGDASTSEDSQYSSNSVDSVETDLSHTPLHQQHLRVLSVHHPIPHNDYMSKQVYI